MIILKEREIEGLLSGTKGTTFSIGPKVKIGISISSKYGNAIIRNKTKRRIRAICREFLPDMEEGYFIILRPTEDFKDMDFERSKINIRQILGKAGVLKQ